MNRVYKASLSLKDLRQLNKDIRYYKNEILPYKAEELLEGLTDAGIRVARMNCGEFGSYIGFVKMVNRHKYNYRCSAILTGYNASQNIVRWVSFNGITEAEVNSIMMAEYGSGQFAINGHRGTFPNQKHAFEDSWWYATEIGPDGRPTDWHRNSGVTPTMPMYKAWYEMKTTIYLVGRRVFNT